MPVPKGMDPVLWYKIENSRKKEHSMSPIYKKPGTGGTNPKVDNLMPKGKKPGLGGHPIGDENDSYLKPGQPDVDDTKGPKFKRPVGDPRFNDLKNKFQSAGGSGRPNFQMPVGKSGGKPGISNLLPNKNILRKAAIAKKLGK